MRKVGRAGGEPEGGSPAAAEREARLAAALRDNLRRRKLQARARDDAAPAPDVDGHAAAPAADVEGAAPDAADAEGHAAAPAADAEGAAPDAAAAAGSAGRSAGDAPDPAARGRREDASG